MLLAPRHIPNCISSLRIVLVLPIGLTLAQHQFNASIWLFGVAAVSDVADGFLARRFGWQSALGAVLDPIADKLLLATVFVILARLGLVPMWLMAAALARDGMIILGMITYRVCVGPLDLHPSFISKLNTLCQSAFVLAVIGRERFSVPTAAILVALGALVSVTIAISGIDYLIIFGKRAAGAQA